MLFAYIDSADNKILSQDGEQRLQEKLYYNELLDGVGTPCYNENINAFSWRSGEESLTRKYHFTYDGLDRLTNVQYRQSDDRNGFYNASYQYNKMGSITHLSRTGLSALPNVYDCIDFDYYL